MSASPVAPIPPVGVAGFDRNQWQLSIGISGKLRLESVAGLDRNQWQHSTGIRTGPPTSVVLTDWLSMQMALGVGSRPACTRVCSRKALTNFSQVPSSRHWAKES